MDNNQNFRNEGYYFRQPTGRNPNTQIVIPDLEAFKAKLARLESLGKSAVTNSFSYSMEAARMKTVLELYIKQEAGQ